MEMEEKKLETNTEQNLPVQELPADIPAEVRQKLAEDLNEEATEDLKQDMREAEREEANDEEVKANPEMLTKSRLLKLLIKKQYVKLREVTEEEQPADLAELLEELDENNRLVVFRLLKKEVATEAFAYMSDEARDDLVNAFSDVELVSAIEEMSCAVLTTSIRPALVRMTSSVTSGRKSSFAGAGAASGSGEFSKAAQCTGGDRNLCGSAGGGQECAGKDHPAQPAAGGPCGKEILRPARRPGGPDLNWNHWADEGRGYL